MYSVSWKHAAVFLALLFAALLCFCCASAEEAADITKECRISVTSNSDKAKMMLNDSYEHVWNGYRNGEIRVTLPQGELAQGVQLRLYRNDTEVVVTDADGNEIARTKVPYRTQWLEFDHPVSQFTVRRANPEDSFQVSRINVLTTGELPEWVQRWTMPEGDMDLMVLVAHPDDEILWFGGLIPYYAGQLQKKTIVVYMVGGLDPTRVLELLDGLWTMGVRLYPDIGTLHDTGYLSIPAALKVWGEDAAPSRVTEVIRRYRPKVIATQDVEGEYGHNHHRITCATVMDVATGKTADPAFFPETAEQYGTWQPHKIYIHLYKENVIRFDWRQPLSTFGGKTGFDIAKEAFGKHRSQHTGKFHLADSGPYDCSLFGLYWSDVGADTGLGDLFENIE